MTNRELARSLERRILRLNELLWLAAERNIEAPVSVQSQYVNGQVSKYTVFQNDSPRRIDVLRT